MEELGVEVSMAMRGGHSLIEKFSIKKTRQELFVLDRGHPFALAESIRLEQTFNLSYQSLSESTGQCLHLFLGLPLKFKYTV